MGENTEICSCGYGSAHFTQTPEGLFCTICSGRVTTTGSNAIRGVWRSRYVLLVDHEPEFREKLEDWLSTLGHQVVCAEDAYSAIEELGNLIRSQISFDLILVDMQVEHLDVVQTLRLLRCLDPRVAIFILADRNPQNYQMVQFKQYGANRIVSRNHFEKLKDTLIKHLEEIG